MKQQHSCLCLLAGQHVTLDELPTFAKSCPATAGEARTLCQTNVTTVTRKRSEAIPQRWHLFSKSNTQLHVTRDVGSRRKQEEVMQEASAEGTGSRAKQEQVGVSACDEKNKTPAILLCMFKIRFAIGLARGQVQSW